MAWDTSSPNSIDLKLCRNFFSILLKFIYTEGARARYKIRVVENKGHSIKLCFAGYLRITHKLKNIPLYHCISQCHQIKMKQASNHDIYINYVLKGHFQLSYVLLHLFSWEECNFFPERMVRCTSINTKITYQLWAFVHQISKGVRSRVVGYLYITHKLKK